MKSYQFKQGLQKVTSHFEKIAKKYEKLTGQPYFYIIGEVETSTVDMFGNVKGDSMFFGDTYSAYNRKVITYRVVCLLYTSPSPRDGLLSRMPSSA